MQIEAPISIKYALCIKKCPKGKKSLGLGRNPPQELKVSPRSGLYLLVLIILAPLLLFLWAWSYTDDGGDDGDYRLNWMMIIG